MPANKVKRASTESLKEIALLRRIVRGQLNELLGFSKEEKASKNVLPYVNQASRGELSLNQLMSSVAKYTFKPGSKWEVASIGPEDLSYDTASKLYSLSSETFNAALEELGFGSDVRGLMAFISKNSGSVVKAAGVILKAMEPGAPEAQAKHTAEPVSNERKAANAKREMDHAITLCDEAISRGNKREAENAHRSAKATMENDRSFHLLPTEERDGYTQRLASLSTVINRMPRD